MSVSNSAPGTSKSQSVSPYFDALSSCLPKSEVFNINGMSILANTNRNFKHALDNLLRFAVGGLPPDLLIHPQEQQSWQESQVRLSQLLSDISGSNNESVLGKRRRDTTVANVIDSNDLKRKKLAGGVGGATADESDPIFILHSLSITSPLRKKVDVAITPSSIKLSNPTTNSLEASVPLSSLTRVFLLPSIGKNNNKPRWNVVFLTADTYDRKSKTGENQPVQVIFGIDATVTGGKDALRTASRNGTNLETTTHSKGDDTLPILQKFISFLPEHVMYLEAIKEPHVDAYRAAKEGTLYFMEQGVLWYEPRPCEFFAVEDLMVDDGGHAGGVKTLSATGRTFSAFVRRKAFKSGHAGEEEEEEELEGEETEFAMVDGKEQERVNNWIRTHKHLFGKVRREQQSSSKPPSTAVNGAKSAVVDNVDDSDDDEDEDFVDDQESDGGSATSSNDEEEEVGDGNVEDEAEESGGEDEDEDEDENGELDPARHPLLRAGAVMPRMSKAVMDAVVGMVEQDFMGNASSGGEDELDDN